jgi:hypothetical protein
MGPRAGHGGYGGYGEVGNVDYRDSNSDPSVVQLVASRYTDYATATSFVSIFCNASVIHSPINLNSIVVVPYLYLAVISSTVLADISPRKLA